MLFRSLEEVCEDWVGVEGDMAKDIVEDVGLGEVVDLVHRADDDGRWELAAGEATEECFGREVAGDWAGLPSGEFFEVFVDAFDFAAWFVGVVYFTKEQRHSVWAQADGAEAVEVDIGGLLFEDIPSHFPEGLPDLVVLLGVAVVEIGRASCRERVSRAGWVSAVAGQPQRKRNSARTVTDSLHM